MNKIKKPISLLLVLVMCLSFLPTAALADVVAEAAHTHNKGGWTCVEQPKLICEVEEHTHDDSCWQAGEQTLTCGLEESGDHHHSEECYTPGERTLVCELEEHTHTDACYKTEWTCTAPVETEGTADETEGETKEPAEETEGTEDNKAEDPEDAEGETTKPEETEDIEVVIPEGATEITPDKLLKAAVGKTVSMDAFFGLIQSSGIMGEGSKAPETLTFVVGGEEKTFEYAGAKTYTEQVTVNADAILLDGAEATVYAQGEAEVKDGPGTLRITAEGNKTSIAVGETIALHSTNQWGIGTWEVSSTALHY